MEGRFENACRLLLLLMSMYFLFRCDGMAGGQRKEPPTEAVKALESEEPSNIKPTSGNAAPTSARRKEGKTEGSLNVNSAPLARRRSKGKSFSNGSEIPGAIREKSVRSNKSFTSGVNADTILNVSALVTMQYR